MEASTGLWNELQAGSYAFMDCDYNAILMQSGVPIGQLSSAEAQAGVTVQGSSGGNSGKLGSDEGAGFQSSLFVLTEVMSLPGPGRAVCDAGLKASSVDSGLPVVAESSGMEGVTYLSASDEHGRLLISDDAATPSLGDKLRLIPGHCDPTVNMYDWIVGVRTGVVEEVWRVAGRGMR
jgi:3-hydroxy-D-aspartate aldolase